MSRRAARLRDGEKRIYEIKAGLTASEKERFDRHAAALGSTGSRLILTALEFFWSVLEEGRAPTSAAARWRQMLEANREAMRAAQDTLQERIDQTDLILLAAECEGEPR